MQSVTTTAALLCYPPSEPCILRIRAAAAALWFSLIALNDVFSRSIPLPRAGYECKSCKYNDRKCLSSPAMLNTCRSKHRLCALNTQREPVGRDGQLRWLISSKHFEQRVVPACVCSVSLPHRVLPNAVCHLFCMCACLCVRVC